jgi:hypothetical protein
MLIRMRRMRWAGHILHMEETRNAYRNLVTKPEGKRPFQRGGHRWEDNIRMVLRKIRVGRCGLDTSGSG